MYSNLSFVCQYAHTNAYTHTCIHLRVCGSLPHLSQRSGFHINSIFKQNLNQDFSFSYIAGHSKIQDLSLAKFKSTGTLAQRLECSPIARETWVQSQVESYQRL